MTRPTDQGIQRLPVFVVDVSLQSAAYNIVSIFGQQINKKCKPVEDRDERQELSSG